MIFPGFPWPYEPWKRSLGGWVGGGCCFTWKFSSLPKCNLLDVSLCPERKLYTALPHLLNVELWVYLWGCSPFLLTQVFYRGTWPSDLQEEVFFPLKISSEVNSCGSFQGRNQLVQLMPLVCECRVHSIMVRNYVTKLILNIPSDQTVGDRT